MRLIYSMFNSYLTDGSAENSYPLNLGTGCCKQPNKKRREHNLTVTFWANMLPKCTIVI